MLPTARMHGRRLLSNGDVQTFEPSLHDGGMSVRPASEGFVE